MSAIATMIGEPRFWVLVVFLSAFGLILSEKIHRTIAAWFGCVCILFLGISMNVFHLCHTVTDAGEAKVGHFIAKFLGSGGEVWHDSLESLMLSWIHFDVIGL